MVAREGGSIGQDDGLYRECDSHGDQQEGTLAAAGKSISHVQALRATRLCGHAARINLERVIRSGEVMRLLLLALLVFSTLTAQDVRIPMRTRVQPFKGADLWESAELNGSFSAAQSAIVICDMWDKHWCGGATNRVAQLAQQMDPVLQSARAAGILVIHAPSDTMDFYKKTPQRLLVLNAPKLKPPPGVQIQEMPLPIDDSDGGCDTPGDHEHQAWSHENPLLSIGPSDAISADGAEIYNLLKQRGINTLFVMGVHTNMCILNRTFAIKQMTRWGVKCVLVRDLTDAMYNPARAPYVPHARGTQLVIEYIERYWCPSTTSKDLMAALVGIPSSK
jgi:Isochorismatase family